MTLRHWRRLMLVSLWVLEQMIVKTKPCEIERKLDREKAARLAAMFRTYAQKTVKVYGAPVTLQWTLTAPKDASERQCLCAPISDNCYELARFKVMQWLEGPVTEADVEAMMDAERERVAKSKPCTGRTRRGVLTVKPWHLVTVDDEATKAIGCPPVAPAAVVAPVIEAPVPHYLRGMTWAQIEAREAEMQAWAERELSNLVAV